MKFKTVILGFLIVIAGLSSACSFKPGPEDTVGNFCKSMKEFDTAGMLNYCSDKTNSFDAAIEKDNPFGSRLYNYFKENLAALTYTVKDPQIADDTAAVPVDFTYVDAGTLFKATLGDYLSKAFSLALSGTELTDEDSQAIFISAFEEEREKIKPVTSEATIEFQCVKTDDGWLIERIDESVINIMSSNFMDTIKQVGSSFDNGTADSQEPSDTGEEVRIDKNSGEEIELATLKLTITDFEESRELVPAYGEPDVAQEGTKFVVIHAEIVNTTNETFNFDGSDIPIVDDKGRKYEFYDDALWSADDALLYVDLAPGIPQKGSFIYQVPSDSASYTMVAGKAGTNEVYYISIK
jgi:hypothetical protein